MEPFYELTHYYTSAVLDIAGSIVGCIERGEAPTEDDLTRMASLAEDAHDEFLDECEET